MIPSLPWDENLQGRKGIYTLVAPSLSKTLKIIFQFSQYLGTKLDMLFEIAQSVEILIILGNTAIPPKILDFMQKV